MTSIFVRVVILWFIFLPIAFLNGFIREATYKRVVGDLAAHQISTLTAIIALFVVSYFFLKPVVANVPTSSLLMAGVIFVTMTMLFEFGFGHYVSKFPWERLLGDYNIFKGRVWGLFLLSGLLMPYLIKALRAIQLK